MARYGDLDRLKERLMVGSELDPEPCKGFRSALLAMVDTQEDADVVPVVRCKDCEHSSWDELGKCYWCKGKERTADFFCADGERRTDGEEA